MDRRTAILTLTGGMVAVSGCLDALDDDDAGDDESEDGIPEEIREALPDYDEPPADEEEKHNRALQIHYDLGNALQSYEWYGGIGRISAYELDDTDETYILVTVRAADRTTAENTIPDEWGGIDIRLQVYYDDS